MPGLFAAFMIALLVTAPCHAQEGSPYLRKLVGQLQATGDSDQQLRLLEEMWANGEKAPKLALVVSSCLSSENERVRRYALRALESFEADLELVRPALKDKSPAIRAKAARVLFSLGIAKDELHPFLRDESPIVREEVGELLVREGIVRLRINRLLKDPAAGVRAGIACALIERGEPLAEFEAMIDDPDAEVRSRVAVALLEAGAEPDRFHRLLSDPKIQSKSDLAVSLLKAGSTRVADCLLATIESAENPDFTQGRLFNAAGPKACAELAPKLAAWVLSGDGTKRGLGLQGLHELQTIPNTAAANITNILRDGTPTAACRVVSLVEDFEKEQRLKALRTALQRDEPEVRRTALAFAPTELLPDVRKLLDDREVRLEAATAVARLDKNDKRCVQVMAECLNPINAQSTDEVCKALRMTGKRVLIVRELLWQTRKAPQADESSIHPVLVAIGGAGEEAPQVIAEWLRRSRDDEEFTGKILNHIYYGYEPGDESLHVLADPIVDVIQRTRNDDVFGIGIQTLVRTGGLKDPTRLKSALGRRYDYYVTACLGRSTKDKRSARDLLLPLLDGDDDDVRFYACLALGQLGGANERIAETLVEILPQRGAFLHSEEHVEELIEGLGPAGKRVMPRLIDVLGTDEFEAFPLSAFLSTGTDPIPHLKAGIVGPHAQYRIGCALRAAEFADAPDAQKRELVGALMEFVESLDLVAISQGESARPDLWEVLKTLSQLQPDESVVPKMVEILKQLPHSHSAGHAADVIGAVGLPARRSLPHLMRLETSWIGWREIRIARAIAKLNNGSLGLTRIRRCLRVVQTQDVHEDWAQVEELMDAIVELGPRCRVLKDDLTAIVNSEFMEAQRRIHAAYALARLFPNEPQWVRTLQNTAKSRSTSISVRAQYRLDQLRKPE